LSSQARTGGVTYAVTALIDMIEGLERYGTVALLRSPGKGEVWVPRWWPKPNGPSSNGASRRCDHHCRGVLCSAWPCPHLAGGRIPRYCIDLCNR